MLLFGGYDVKRKISNPQTKVSLVCVELCLFSSLALGSEPSGERGRWKSKGQPESCREQDRAAPTILTTSGQGLQP